MPILWASLYIIRRKITRLSALFQAECIPMLAYCISASIVLSQMVLYKKHLKNVGPIRHCQPLHAACSNFTLPFTRCRYCRHHYQDEPKPAIAIAQAACDSSNVKSMSTTTTTTTRDRGDRYGSTRAPSMSPLITCWSKRRTFICDLYIRY